MRFRSLLIAMLGGASLALPAAAQAQPAAQPVWTIPARTLPPPVHASDALREAIAKTPSPDPEKAKAAMPKTVAEWRTLLAKTEGGATDAALYAIAKATNVAVVPDKIAGVQVYRVTPPSVTPELANMLFVYIHGGAWVKGGGAASSVEALSIARHLGIPALSIDYRMAPDHPAPAATDDTLAVWRALLKERAPGTMVMGGTSAGANLVLATMLRAKAEGLAMPAGLMVGTPAADLAKTTDTRFLMEGVDRYLPSWDAEPAGGAALYAAGADTKNPFLSPIYGDMAGFPPTYLITGTRDMLLSDTALVHRKLRRAGVRADLHVYEGHSHGDYALMAGTPESEEHYRELGAFVHEVTGKTKLAMAGLEGTTWQLVAFVSSDDTIGRLTPEDPSRYTLAFPAPGRLSLRLDCNRGSGQYSGGLGISGPLSLKPLAMTRAACRPTPLYKAMERSLPMIRRFSLADGKLNLSLDSDSGILEFENVASTELR